MFACESILKNSNIATLEIFNNQPRWWVKDALLTERAFYLFPEKGDLLGDEYDKLEMSQFRSARLSTDENDLNSPSPAFIKQLPPFKAPYTHLIEMLNKKTQKRRIIACESAVQADEYVNLLNLVNSYLNYEHLFSSEGQQAPIGQQSDGKGETGSQPQNKRSGPIFITNWVQNYNQHQGVMEFKEEVFDQDNFPYLLSFARENESIRSLVFPSNSLIFAGNEVRSLQAIQQVLSTFSRESVTSFIMRDNYLVDQVFKSIIPSLSQYERLTYLEVSNNGLTNQSLEAMGMVFANCPLITKINLSGNLLGQGSNQQQSVDMFLLHMLTELDQPQHLDLQDNKFTDESLTPFIKYIFANEECKLLQFSLENNSFSSFGKRTLLKAYSLCQNKQQLQFKCGPLPFTESTLKHAFNVQYETKVTTGKGGPPKEEKVLKSMNRDKLEMRITRKPNYPGMLKGLPISKHERDQLHQIFAKIDQTVSNRMNVFIEDIRDLLQEISKLSFEFPRHKLEPIFDVVNEKLYQSMECENIYCLEVLLDCLRYMNGRNLKAEDKYAELSIVAASVGKDLLKVLNMELMNDNELNQILDDALDQAKRIGMRGEIIDVAVTLKMLRNNFLTEMQNKSNNSDDEGNGFGEDQQQLEFYDEDKTLNVYDEKYDVYIDMSAEELGITSEVEPNLGYHPLSSDYLKISNLNLNYVRKNLKEAQKFLRDEESYAYRNIFDRCYFLLCDSTEDQTLSSKAYNLAKNDSNLKLARLVFRYKNNLDQLFPVKLEPYPSTLAIKASSQNGQSKPDESKIYQYKFLLAKEYVEFNGTKLTHPVSKIDKNKAPIAVVFNRALYTLCETEDITKNQLYGKIQELFEEYVVKKGKIINEELHDEFYLQIFRQINRKNMQQSEKSAKAIANALFVLALYSRYVTPSKDLLEPFESWLISLRERTGAEFFRLISIILNNFTIVKRVDDSTKPYVNWPPCFAEIDSIVTGEPIQIQVYTPTGDVYQYTIDETTTVESLLQQQVWKEKFFAKEPDPEVYWLYQHVERPDHFDHPLSKDKRILKILYKNEKAQDSQFRKSGYASETSESPSPKKYSFMKKKSQKFMRKQTMFASMDALQDNEYQNTILLIKKRLFSALHIDRNVKTLAKKSLNFLYHQVRMDYIEKNILRRMSNYEDVSLFAALVLKVKYWGKILRSKDNSLTKDLIIKNIDYAIPATFLREKSQDYWVNKIQKDFDRQNMRELSIEEAQERFLTQFANYQLAFSNYYVLKAQPANEKDGQSNDDSSASQRQVDLDESDDFSTFGNNRDTFLSNHMNHDILCVINFNGLSFFDNQKRDKPIQRVNYEDLLYVMGSNNTLKISFIQKGQLRQYDVQVELYTTAGLNARVVAEDIISYCQLRLAECTKNDSIEIVKRNIINIFEDIEDPYDEENGSPNRSNNSTFRKSTNLHAVRKSNVGAFDFLSGDNLQADRNQHETSQSYQHVAKHAIHKLQIQRGNQFKLKEKFLAYIRKYPLYMQKTLAPGTMPNSDSQKSLRRKSIMGQQPGPTSIKGSFSSQGSKDRNSALFKLQLSTQRIEEDKEEDEDDSTPSRGYVTGDDPLGSGRCMRGQMKQQPLTNKSTASKISPSNPQPSTVMKKPSENNLLDSIGERKDTFQQMPNFHSKKTNFSFRGHESQSKITSSHTSLRKESDFTQPEDLPPPKKDSIAAGQLAVINELFKSSQPPERVEPTFGKKSGFMNDIMKGKDQEDEVPTKEGEAMVLGQKVNYDEMDKSQKKENLGNLLSAAFGFMPPPPK